MRILSGDIGGTKAQLAVFESDGEALVERGRATYRSSEHPSLEALLTTFLDTHGAPCQWACFGVPGPVRAGRAKITNLPWIVDARLLARRLGIAHVAILNDLEATAHGLVLLRDDDLLVVKAGQSGVGNAAVIAAGTGLGEAGLFWDGRRHRPFPSEGGHASFAPSTELDVALLRHLQGRFGHVSWERVLSGPGLVHLYTFLRDHRRADTPSWLAEEMERGDAAAAISDAALEERCGICSEALDVFVRLYGAEAGNLALKVMATAGVYVGGGIAPKIARRLCQPTFIDAFRNKGRMAPLLDAIPVRVILTDRAALLGPARYALTAVG
jgi:glucokinase